MIVFSFFFFIVSESNVPPVAQIVPPFRIRRPLPAENENNDLPGSTLPLTGETGGGVLANADKVSVPSEIERGSKHNDSGESDAQVDVFATDRKSMPGAKRARSPTESSRTSASESGEESDADDPEGAVEGPGSDWDVEYPVRPPIVRTGVLEDVADWDDIDNEDVAAQSSNALVAERNNDVAASGARVFPSEEPTCDETAAELVLNGLNTEERAAATGLIYTAEGYAQSIRAKARAEADATLQRARETARVLHEDAHKMNRSAHEFMIEQAKAAARFTERSVRLDVREQVLRKEHMRMLEDREKAHDEIWGMLCRADAEVAMIRRNAVEPVPMSDEKLKIEVLRLVGPVSLCTQSENGHQWTVRSVADTTDCCLPSHIASYYHDFAVNQPALDTEFRRFYSINGAGAPHPAYNPIYRTWLAMFIRSPSWAEFRSAPAEHLTYKFRN